MNRTIRNSSSGTSLNFRQWSRKGYAIFSSLGKTVRIAVLKMAVTAKLQAKGKAEEMVEMVHIADLGKDNGSPNIEQLLADLLFVNNTVVIKPVIADYQSNKLHINFHRCPANFCW